MLFLDDKTGNIHNKKMLSPSLSKTLTSTSGHSRTKTNIMKKIILVFFILLWWSGGLFAQKINPQVISSAGSRYQTNTMSIDWTLGELSITTIQGTSNIISQGFHQSRYIVTATDELSKDLRNISVYPNPTSDLIQMDISFDVVRSVHVYLKDVNGKQIWNNKYYGQQITESTSLSNLPNGMYFLSFIIDGNKSTQTFKIQKIY